MNSVQPRLLKGFRDTFATTMRTRQHLIGAAEQVLLRYGFQPLETPALEYADILLGKLGDEGEKLLYRFTDHGDRDVALRYDFTVPLARVMAQYTDLPKPFKRYQVGPVWRADNTQRGRFREFYQFDMDIVGSDSPLADAEILVVMQQILQSIGLTDFRIRINDRQLLASIAQQANLASALTSIFYTGLDKWDKIGGADGVAGYWQQHGIHHDTCQKLLELLQDQQSAAKMLSPTLERAKDLGLDQAHITIDPTIVRGLDYYTGIVFETTLTHAPHYGSVLSGGRYDGLIGRFAKQDIPAVGASIGVDRLMAAMDELGIDQTSSQSAQLFVTIFNPELEPLSLQTAAKLRQADVPVEVSYLSQNLGKQLKYAASRGIPWVIIIGPDEAEQNLVTLRNLQTGTEQKLPANQIVANIAPTGKAAPNRYG